MKRGKRLAALLLAASLLAGCSTGAPSSSAPQSQPESVAATAAPAPLQPTASNGLPLPDAGISALTGREGDYTKRPVAVMLYNSKAALPQWGIGSADILIEALTEGADTRMMAVYPDHETVEKVGPAGPARDVFLQMVMPFSAIPMFVGGDVYSSNLLNLYAYQPLDGMYAGTTAFDFDSERGKTYRKEFCWYARKELIPAALEQYGQSTQGDTPSFFKFAEGEAANAGGGSLEIGYSESRIALLEYDGSDQRYYLKENGEPQWDATKEDGAVRFSNVVLLMARSGYKDDGVTREYDLTKGDGLYLSQGGAVQIQWQKGSPASPLKLYDAQGQELSVQPGRTYIGVWGGFGGQTLRLLGQDGSEQAMPASPEPLPTPEPTPEPVPEGEPAPAE